MDTTRSDASHRHDRPANQLAGETSPYLLQHAHNPVDWHPWGPGAIDRARSENKPIFLSIGYSACHWCHVMERESFENPDIAAVMNEHFINIKVDREKRPDLDQIYMNAVQAMTGQEFRAGWPQGIAPLGLPQIRTCPLGHTARHIMHSLRDGSLSESALRLVPDSATVVGSCTRLWEFRGHHT